MPELSLPSQRSRRFWLLLSLASAFWCAIVLALQLSLPSLEPRVYFLDVGQGDAALVITSQYQKVLIDGGPDASILGELNRVLPFWDKTLDALLLSHSDSDHLQGLLPIAAHFKIRNLYLGLTNDINPLLQQLIDRITAQGGKITLLQADRDLVLAPDLAFDILSPLETRPTLAKPRNDASIVLKLLTPYESVLFTGDISEKQEKILVQRYGDMLRSHILKVPHHGSASSSSKPFLAAIQPTQAVISVGQDNPFRHPRSEALARLTASGATIIRTDLCGTIELKFLPAKTAGFHSAC